MNLGHGMVYDSVQDLTFMQDVRLARTLGQDDDGGCNWADAHAWVADLAYGGRVDWRLPQFLGSIVGRECLVRDQQDAGAPWLEQPGRLRQPERPVGRLQKPGSHGPFINLANGLDGAWLTNSDVRGWVSVWQDDLPDARG